MSWWSQGRDINGAGSTETFNGSYWYPGPQMPDLPHYPDRDSAHCQVTMGHKNRESEVIITGELA